MQLGRQFIPTAARYDHVFAKSMKRNRVELVSDFPNDAEVISSLQVLYHIHRYYSMKWKKKKNKICPSPNFQIHPHGWCALSRNISYDESSEYSCLHDIQQREYDEVLDDCDSESGKQRKPQDPPTIINIPRRISVPANVIMSSGGNLSNISAILLVPNRSSVLNLAESYDSNAPNESNANDGADGANGSNRSNRLSEPGGSNESSSSSSSASGSGNGSNVMNERSDLIENNNAEQSPASPAEQDPAARPAGQPRGNCKLEEGESLSGQPNINL